jgi:hypothetical protein
LPSFSAQVGVCVHAVAFLWAGWYACLPTPLVGPSKRCVPNSTR